MSMANYYRRPCFQLSFATTGFQESWYEVPPDSRGLGGRSSISWRQNRACIPGEFREHENTDLKGRILVKVSIHCCRETPTIYYCRRNHSTWILISWWSSGWSDLSPRKNILWSASSSVLSLWVRIQMEVSYLSCLILAYIHYVVQGERHVAHLFPTSPYPLRVSVM